MSHDVQAEHFDPHHDLIISVHKMATAFDDVDDNDV